MPSLAQFGEREPDSARRAGKRVLKGAARPLSPSRITRAKGRDTLLEEELKKAFNKEDDPRGNMNFLHCGLETSEARIGGKARAVDRDLSSHVFDGPQIDKARPPRIRPDFNEEQLSALVEKDTRKEVAAAGMANSSDMLVKMMSDNYPIQRKPASPPRRKQKGPQLELSDACEPAGFAGLGQRSKPEARRGVSVKPVEPFVVGPEDMVPAGRVGGKKMVRGSDGTTGVAPSIGSHRVTSGVFNGESGAFY